MKFKIKKGDVVKVISGKYKNKEGEVLKVLYKNNTVIVKSLNLKKKTFKKTENEEGKIIDIESPIHLSNVKIV